MTWEETITLIQNDPSLRALVRDTYLDPYLPANVERFRLSAEFKATQALLAAYPPVSHPHLLDIGAGNGVASIAFALEGYQVTALEPDPSACAGREAIKILAAHYQLDNVKVLEAFGEKLPLEDNSFDIVYVRQAMHHAADLVGFMKEAARVLKQDGQILTLRDHLVRGEKDKAKFLQRHPLHRFYGGENAFTLAAYRAAFQQAGLEVVKQLSPAEFAINYDPWSKEQLRQYLSSKLGKWAISLDWLVDLAWWLSLKRKAYIPGRLVSFVLRKK